MKIYPPDYPHVVNAVMAAILFIWVGIVVGKHLLH